MVNVTTPDTASRSTTAVLYSSTVQYCWAFSGSPASLDGVVVPKTLLP